MTFSASRPAPPSKRHCPENEPHNTRNEIQTPCFSGGWSLDKGTSITSHVKGWTGKDCAVRWKTRLAQPGSFQVVARYDAPEPDKAKIETYGGAISAPNQQTVGGTFTATIGGRKLKGKVREQDAGIALDLGRVSLEPGDVEISVRADEITGKELMQLKSLTLTPAGLGGGPVANLP